MIFWFRSGSADPWLWLYLDPDPDVDPSIFIIDLQDAGKKRIFSLKAFWRYFYIIFQS